MEVGRRGQGRVEVGRRGRGRAARGAIDEELAKKLECCSHV